METNFFCTKVPFCFSLPFSLSSKSPLYTITSPSLIIQQMETIFWLWVFALPLVTIIIYHQFFPNLHMLQSQAPSPFTSIFYYPTDGNQFWVVGVCLAHSHFRTLRLHSSQHQEPDHFFLYLCMFYLCVISF